MSDFLQTPNIFKYASSELSQDAVICWILDGLNYPRTAIHSFSKAFLSLILKNALNQIHKYRDFSSSDVTGVKIEQQKYNIDILATLEIDNGYGKQFVTLIIEDKTFTTRHDDQLFRYKQRYNDKEPICIYYKTGFIFNDRIIANANGYAVVDINDMYDLMQSFEDKLSSDIFRGYYEHIRDLKYEYDRIDKVPQDNLDSHVGQFILMSTGFHPIMTLLLEKQIIPIIYHQLSLTGLI